jgi:Ca-activated chloride channel homolog
VRRLLPLVAALGLGILASASARAQAPAAQTPPKPFTLEVDVNVVSVTAVVFDKSGHAIRGLGPKDVELYEDGVRQEVSYFREASGEAADRIPLSVVLVLDNSGSMNPNMRFLQEAVLNFVYKLEEVDQALVVSFNESVKGSAEFTGDTDRLERFVEGMQAWGGTSLYDAIRYSLERIKDQPGRKAAIVFTDGDDTTSSSTDQQTVDYARSVEATVYSIGFRGQPGIFGGGGKGFLKKIADETGGLYFFPDKIGDLIRIFQSISEELKNHYLLSYSPKRDPDGNWRTITLKVTARADAQVRVRKGYFAMKKRRPAPPKAPTP